VDSAHLPSYLDEFVFRFNRRRSRSRGMLFYRVVAMPAPTTLSLLGSFRLGSRLMQTAWTTWNGCDGLAASSARAAVVREDGGLGTAGSCVLDAVAAHQ
jgi:hypothetical protein